MFSQVGFPTINPHLRRDPVPMFVRYPRHRLRSVPPALFWAMQFDGRYELAFAPSAAICAISRDLRHQPRSGRGLSRNEIKYLVAITTNSSEKRLKMKE
jgi:hypothetical protein